MDEHLANAVATAGDDHELFLPVPAVARPVVESASVEETIQPARKAEVEAYLQALQSQGVGKGEFALARISGEKDERKGERWVKNCLLNDALDNVGGETWRRDRISPLVAMAGRGMVIPSRGSHPFRTVRGGIVTR